MGKVRTPHIHCKYNCCTYTIHLLDIFLIERVTYNRLLLFVSNETLNATRHTTRQIRS